MSDELERRLRETGLRLPSPHDHDTDAIRARVVDARVERRTGRRRTAALALVLAAAIGGAFGVGYAIAGNGSATPATRIVHVKAALDAGPGFLPADGWDTVARGTGSPAIAAVAANVSLEPQDRELLGPPTATVQKLGADGVVLYATFGAVSPAAHLPQRLLPLQLDDARPSTGSTRALRVRVAAWEIDVRIIFGSGQPSAAVLAAAREELGRLVVPACPAAQELAPGAADAAKAFVLAWLPAHYAGSAADVAGATAVAAVGPRAPRHGQAAYECGAAVARRSVEVDVTLPRVAAVSASLSELTYFVAKTFDGWTVWSRAR